MVVNGRDLGPMIPIAQAVPDSNGLAIQSIKRRDCWHSVLSCALYLIRHDEIETAIQRLEELRDEIAATIPEMQKRSMPMRHRQRARHESPSGYDTGEGATLTQELVVRRTDAHQSSKMLHHIIK